MGKYLIALLALTAILSMSLAYGQEERTIASVTVNPQEINNTFITVARAEIPQSGWVVIHNVIDGRPGGVIGFAHLDQGGRADLRVPIDVNASTENLVAELHYDRGMRNCFEFPGEDVVVRINNLPVLVPFTLKLGQELQQKVSEHQDQMRQLIQKTTGQNRSLNVTQLMQMNQTMGQPQMVNQTTQNQTMMNQIMQNQTMMNQTTQNQTMMNQTMQNQTMVNQTTRNQTMMNQTTRNQTMM